MKIIDQSHTLLFENPNECITNTQRIELAARTCYKSEGKITTGSDIKLCQKLRDRGHFAMFEHAYLIFEVSNTLFRRIFDVRTPYMNFSVDEGRYIVSANIRAWRDFIIEYEHFSYFNNLRNKLKMEEPVLFRDILLLEEKDNGEYINIIPEEDLSVKELVYHKRFSVRFITDRGVTHELVRHRPASFAQESTRFCKYDGDMEFIRPAFDWTKDLEKTICLDNDDSMEDWQKACIWYNTMEELAERYVSMISNNASPQEARSVLPNSLKTEIVVTADVQEWIHIFSLRTVPAAHPQIRELMLNFSEELSEKFPWFPESKVETLPRQTDLPGLKD